MTPIAPAWAWRSAKESGELVRTNACSEAAVGVGVGVAAPGGAAGVGGRAGREGRRGPRGEAEQQDGDERKHAAA